MMENFWSKLKKPFNVLAPMEDVTDIVFRKMVLDMGRPDVFFTEFTNVDGLASVGRERVINRLLIDPNEKPVVAQIWGLKPENYYKAAKDIVEMGFSGVDINMGCPVKKIVKNGACSAMIDNPSLAAEVISATKKGAAGNIPVSVKTRIGFRTKKTEEWGEFLLKQDLEAITIHGRISKDMSKLPADWGEIKKIVEMRNNLKSNTIVIGNGDVLSLDEIQKKHQETGVDGVMIGRGVFQDPFIFNPNKSLQELTLNERLDLILKHAELFTKTWGKTKPFVVLRRFFKIYLTGLEDQKTLKSAFLQTESLEDVHLLINGNRR